MSQKERNQKSYEKAGRLCCKHSGFPGAGNYFPRYHLDLTGSGWIETYEMVMKILNPGGYILADNTLWDGHVIDPAYDRDRKERPRAKLVIGAKS